MTANNGPAVARRHDPGGDHVVVTLTPNFSADTSWVNNGPLWWSLIDSVDANLGSYDPATGIWTVGELANGGGGFVTIYVTVAETGAYTTQAAITASSRPDPNESNNSTG
jgi:hypothetical protein